MKTTVIGNQESGNAQSTSALNKSQDGVFEGYSVESSKGRNAIAAGNPLTMSVFLPSSGRRNVQEGPKLFEGKEFSSPADQFSYYVEQYGIPESLSLEAIIGEEAANKIRSGEAIEKTKANELVEVLTLLNTARSLMSYYFSVISNTEMRGLGHKDLEAIERYIAGDIRSSRAWEDSTCRSQICGHGDGGFGFKPEFFSRNEYTELRDIFTSRNRTAFIAAAKRMTDTCLLMAIAHKTKEEIVSINVNKLVEDGALTIPGRWDTESITKQKKVFLKELSERGVPLELLSIQAQWYLSNKDNPSSISQKNCEWLGGEINECIRRINYIKALSTGQFDYVDLSGLETGTLSSYITESSAKTLLERLKSANILERFKGENDGELRFYSSSHEKFYTFDLNSMFIGGKAYADNDVVTLQFCIRESFFMAFFLSNLKQGMYDKAFEGHVRTSSSTSIESGSSEETESTQSSEVLSKKEKATILLAVAAQLERGETIEQIIAKIEGRGIPKPPGPAPEWKVLPLQGKTAKVLVEENKERLKKKKDSILSNAGVTQVKEGANILEQLKKRLATRRVFLKPDPKEGTVQVTGSMLLKAVGSSNDPIAAEAQHDDSSSNSDDWSD